MKLLTTALTLLIVIAGFSQKSGNITTEPDPYSGSFAELHYWKYQLSSPNDTSAVKAILTRELGLSANDKLHVKCIKTSLTATHITFNQFYKNSPVIGGGAKVAISKGNVLFRCFETIFPTSEAIATLPTSFNTSEKLSELGEVAFLADHAAYLWNGNVLIPG